MDSQATHMFLNQRRATSNLLINSSLLILNAYYYLTLLIITWSCWLLLDITYRDFPVLLMLMNFCFQATHTIVNERRATWNASSSSTHHHSSSFPQVSFTIVSYQHYLWLQNYLRIFIDSQAKHTFPNERRATSNWLLNYNQVVTTFMITYYSSLLLSTLAMRAYYTLITYLSLNNRRATSKPRLFSLVEHIL